MYFTLLMHTEGRQTNTLTRCLTEFRALSPNRSIIKKIYHYFSVVIFCVLGACICVVGSRVNCNGHSIIEYVLKSNTV